MDSTLLYVTLALALISFLCSTYTTLRTLLPLLPDHPLNPRQNITGPPPASNDDKRPRLKSAQRFTAYLALTDVFATCILIWEVACAVSSNSRLGYSRLSDSRIVLATTARPTLLLIVAVLSYVNVVQGRAISLGFADCIVWGPALVLYSLGAGLASLGTVDGKNVWIGLIVWLSTVTGVVTFCFTRLLIAILRVRSITKREQAFSPWAREQEKAIRISSEQDMPYNRYSLTFHPNFSGLSANFVGTISRSSNGPPRQLRDSIPYTSDTRSAVSYGPTRPSYEQQDQVEEFEERDFRSITPGSAHGLLDRSAVTTPASNFSESTRNRLNENEEEVLEERARHSIGESIASRASTYLAGGGFVGGSAVRQAIIREAWRGQDPPGTGHSPKVELSDRETRGAMIRLGGHLASSLLAYALVSPLVCLRIANTTSSVPLIASILLAIGVCQPPIVLAYQCWMSEGFWHRRSTSNINEIEVVTTDEARDRSASRASTIETWKSSVPGIPIDGRDISSNHRGRMGRALSVLSAHPKLQLLNSSEAIASTSGFVKSATSQGHARLRSLKLSKLSCNTMGDLQRPRSRANSTTSRKTVGGFEHSRVSSTPVNDFDKAIAMQLLASRRKLSTSERKGDLAIDQNSFIDLPHTKRTPSLSHLPSPAPSPSPPGPVHDFEFSTHEITISPSSSTFPTTPATRTYPEESTRPISIDYLSAQVLPQLVPSLRLGHLHIEPRSDPIPTPPRSADPLSSPSTKFARGPRKLRSRSFPGFSLGDDMERSHAGYESAEDEVWIAVEEEVAKGNPVSEDEKTADQEMDAGIGECAEQTRTTIHHERSGSSMTRLDISFEWEAVDSTEVLDDSIPANDSTIPFSPILPLSISRRPSPQPAIDDDDDVHTSTFHCATVRPVSRNSDISTSFESPRLVSRPKQEESHERSRSLDSARALGDANQSSITSEGFRNLLNSGSWHAQALPTNDQSPCDVQLSAQPTLPRRPLPTPPLRPGHRPLSLLGQRDLNLATSLSESDTEQQKTTRYTAARKAEESVTHPSTRPNIPLPPIPAMIKEVDEDRKSGTPTPKSRRTLRARRDSENRQTPTTSSSTSRTPPNVTSRSRLRSRHQRNASSMSVNDENVQIQEITKISKTPRSTKPPPLSLRAMR